MLFPDGKQKALTLSYDDGVMQDRKLVGLLNRYRIKATFNLGSGLLGLKETAVIDGLKVDVSKVDKEDVPDLYKGHEVAGHGYTHMALDSADTGTAMLEVIKDRNELETITGSFVRGFAYPFGVFDEYIKSVIKLAGIEYARTVKPVKDFGLPYDYLEWNPTCHHNDKDLMQLAGNFCNSIGHFGQPKLFYLWGHSYEFDQYDNWNVIEGFLSYMSEHKEEIWSAPNIEIIDYLNAYKQLRYSADGNMVYNPSSLDIWIKVWPETCIIHSGETVKLKHYL